MKSDFLSMGWSDPTRSQLRGSGPDQLHASVRDDRGHHARDLGGAHRGGQLLLGGEESPGGGAKCWGKPMGQKVGKLRNGGTRWGKSREKWWKTSENWDEQGKMWKKHGETSGKHVGKCGKNRQIKI